MRFVDSCGNTQAYFVGNPADYGLTPDCYDLCPQGCTDQTASNYDPSAVIDDGSCVLNAPTLTRFSCNGDGHVIFAWNYITPHSSYRLQTNGSYFLNASNTWSDVAITNVNSWGGDVGGIAFGGAWYRVRAETGWLVSDWSNLVRADCRYAS